MTDKAESEFAEDCDIRPTDDQDFEISPGQVMRRLDDVESAMRGAFERSAQDLRKDLERVAAAVAPLLTKQYSETAARMRVLETRLRNRQERPLIVLLANLLADIRRLKSAEDVREHVEQTITDALVRAGYQEVGSPGDQFDPAWHEAMSGSVGRGGIVSHVYSRGLACYGDVIIKARVDVDPAPAAESEQGELLT